MLHLNCHAYDQYFVSMYVNMDIYFEFHIHACM